MAVARLMVSVRWSQRGRVGVRPAMPVCVGACGTMFVMAQQSENTAAQRDQHSGGTNHAQDGDSHKMPTWVARLNPVVRHVVLQFVGFGVIGFVCFFIDWGLLNVFVAALGMNPTVSGSISFLISLVVNYLASMQFVFIHRVDMARWMELTIFVICSVIGLIINGLIIAAMTQPFIGKSSHGFIVLMTNIAKIVATIIVSVWNFFSRKFTIDAPRAGHENDNTFAHRIGLWSLQHGPARWQRPQGAPTMAASLITSAAFSSKWAMPADPVALPFYEARIARGVDPVTAAEETAVLTRGLSRKIQDRQATMNAVAGMLGDDLATMPVDPPAKKKKQGKKSR